MSPIYTRPIREQLEHDRVIRQLEIRYKRKHEVAINPGSERNHGVNVGEYEVFPDLVLFNPARNSKIEGTVEVETGESVHLLEARAEWGIFSRLKAPFHLYVPPQMIDSARRLCDEHQFPVAEIWTYHIAIDQVRFTQVYRSPSAIKASAAAVKAALPKKPAEAKTKPAVAARSKSPGNNGKAAPKKAAAKAASKTAKVAKAAKPPARSRTAKPAARRAPVKKRR